jgi:alpha,alpha-trehalase
MSPKAASLGRDLVYKWVLNNYCAWNETRSHGGYMFEKYDATRVGLPGGGGEYEVQEGFGWTNGVMLELLASHGKWLRLNHTCTELATRFNSRKH